MPKRTRPHRETLLEELTDPVFAAAYLNEARHESHKIFLKALRNVAEARRIAVVAAKAGVNRESLYRTLSEEGNPRLETYESVLDALGIDYEFKPKGVHITAPAPPIESKQTTYSALLQMGTTPTKFVLTGDFGSVTTTLGSNATLVTSANSTYVRVSDNPSLPLDFIAYATEKQSGFAIDHATGD